MPKPAAVKPADPQPAAEAGTDLRKPIVVLEIIDPRDNPALVRAIQKRGRTELGRSTFSTGLDTATNIADACKWATEALLELLSD